MARHRARGPGITATDAKRGGEGLTLASYRDEEGRALVDLPDAPLPDPGHAGARSGSSRTGTRTCWSTRDGPASARAVPAARVQHPQSVLGRDVPRRRRRGGRLVRKDGRIVLDPFEDLTASDRRAVEREREALEPSRMTRDRRRGWLPAAAQQQVAIPPAILLVVAFVDDVQPLGVQPAADLLGSG